MIWAADIYLGVTGIQVTFKSMNLVRSSSKTEVWGISTLRGWQEEEKHQ